MCHTKRNMCKRWELSLLVRGGSQTEGSGSGAQRKPRKRRVEAEVRALTQEELLAEAAETELLNTASLARLIAVEEEARAPLRPCSAGRGALLACYMPRQRAIKFSILSIAPIMVSSSVSSM